MAKVSVIVPVYGVEKFIERCSRSLFEQTLDDMEFIFVDDCSPDNSMNILRNVIKDYPNREHQVVLHRMPVNSGLAKVRKQGYKMATGEFVIACDSDDYVERTMYESMYKFAMDNELDLVHCDIEIVDDGHIIDRLTIKEDVTSEELRRGLINGSISNSLCNKLIKRTLLVENEIHYAEAPMDEDNTLAVQFAHYAKKLGYIKKGFYKAFQNSASISREPGVQQTLRRYDGSFKNSQVIVEFLLSHGYKEKDMAVINAKLRAKMSLCPSLKEKGIVKKWIKTYPEVNTQIFKSHDVSLRVKVKCALIMFHLFPFAKKIMKLS